MGSGLLPSPSRRARRRSRSRRGSRRGKRMWRGGASAKTRAMTSAASVLFPAPSGPMMMTPPVVGELAFVSAATTASLSLLWRDCNADLTMDSLQKGTYGGNYLLGAPLTISQCAQRVQELTYVLSSLSNSV